MFSKSKFVKAIQTGDLEKVKRLVNEKHGLLYGTFEWKIFESGKKLHYEGSAIHMAAYFNQPAIVEYLVHDKGVAVNKLSTDDWTPLHHAAKGGARRAVEMLLKLDANPHAKNDKRSTPSDLTNDTVTKDLIKSYIDKKQEQENEAAKQKEAAARKEKTGGMEGTWAISAPDEITHARELPGGRYSLTQVFNFAAGTLTTITENLINGSIVPETKSFAEVPAQKKIIEEARAQLAEMTGVPAPNEAARAVKRPPHSYTAITEARLQ